MTILKKINIKDIEKQIEKKMNKEYEKNGNDSSFFFYCRIKNYFSIYVKMLKDLKVKNIRVEHLLQSFNAENFQNFCNGYDFEINNIKYETKLLSQDIKDEILSILNKLPGFSENCCIANNIINLNGKPYKLISMDLIGLDMILYQLELSNDDIIIL